MKVYIWVTKRKGKRGIRYLVRWIEPNTGKNRAKSFPRLEDAREYESNLRKDFRNNDYHAPVRISFDKWKEKLLEDLLTSPDVDVKPGTVAIMKRALADLGQLCNPKTPLDITPRMIRDFRCKLLEKGLSKQTINKKVRHIRSTLSYAVRAEIIPHNKLFGPHRLELKNDQKPPRILEVGEVTALMNVASDLQQKAAISLAYYHGMRRGEICNLQWQGVDLDNMILTFPDSKKHYDRKVALRGETADLLRQLCVQRINEYVFEKPGVFYWHIGKVFEELVEKAEIDHCTLHDLRKTCNTQMKEAGFSEEVAMQVLGHKQKGVNQIHYTGTLIKQQRAAVDSLPSIG